MSIKKDKNGIRKNAYNTARNCGCTAKEARRLRDLANFINLVQNKHYRKIEYKQIKDIEAKHDQKQYIRYLGRDCRSQKNIVIKLIRDANGLKHENNGAYKEELSHFKYPYRNFNSGVVIDEFTRYVQEYGLSLSENDVIEIMHSHLHTISCNK